MATKEMRIQGRHRCESDLCAGRITTPKEWSWILVSDQGTVTVCAKCFRSAAPVTRKTILVGGERKAA
jgi:hypothetical protein